ncbi:MAG TPA: hypothetical protein DDW76_14770 [Cyanobacteria bacterium UBA11369]|nr:hypothetical protein [Cyanobacteria bacterium UBA11371]HBE17586.1 hypothetical protein [Cyanobacteria bacterium UBA11367]HBE36088.1 hypothetical protein [Cyanobacteria bacterium UBA11368]HBE50020.1 hypothetical protein [Cyanobacteria bacterium UBA11369]
MSGEKRRYVSVDEQELRRLREQESRLRSVQNDLPQRLNAVREEARREFQQRLAPLEQRARQQEQQTQQLKSSLADLERDTQKRLQQQRQEFQTAVRESEYRQQQALQRETSRLESAMQQGFQEQRQEYLRITAQQRQEYTSLIAQQDQKFTQLIAQERQARERGQQILQQQIDGVVANIEQERQRKAQLAEDLLSDVEEIWEQINRDYQHQRFAPGRLNDLHRGLEMARNNIQAGVTEAAIATSQQTYLDLADLRLELEQKEQEWLLLYNAALADLKSLIAEVQANRQCEIEVGQADEAEKFKLEVDYWVNGGLSEYEQQLDRLESQLKAGESTLTTEQVKELGEKITALQPTLGEIVEEAKLAILGSQLRVEIADRVVDVLSSLGYTLINSESDAVYEGDDQRNAYVVKVKNIAGDEVVTVISPEKEFGTNSVSINTFSQTIIDETATKQNATAIFDTLENEGVQGNGAVECNQQARPEYQNMQEVKQRQVAQQQQRSQAGS